MIDVFTSAAPNYLGKVRALCESLRDYLPTARVHWLATDVVRQELVDGLAEEPFDSIIFASELDGVNRGWLFRYTLVELSTAVKPAAAQHLLRQPDCDMVLYFDPDTVVFSGLDDLVEQVAASSLALTPHQLQPEVDPSAFFHELDSLRYGVFNLGFFGVRRCEEADRALEWWRSRCHLTCSGDWTSGSFTDQKWLNFAPIFFDGVTILKNPRFNVAPWNLSQRELRGSFDEGFTVDGQPLGFYHFTGFDSGAHAEHVRGLAGNHQSAEMLIDWYEQRTELLSIGRPATWGLGAYSDGTPIEDIHRTAYRLRQDLQKTFSDPYLVEKGGRCFLEWFKHKARVEIPEIF